MSSRHPGLKRIRLVGPADSYVLPPTHDERVAAAQAMASMPMSSSTRTYMYEPLLESIASHSTPPDVRGTADTASDMTASASGSDKTASASGSDMTASASGSDKTASACGSDKTSSASGSDKTSSASGSDKTASASGSDMTASASDGEKTATA
jgi:hypothetical protein